MAAELLSNPTFEQTSAEIIHGSCLCGAITYTVTGAPKANVLCHCISCKKSSGSSFMANAFCEASQLTFTSSTATLKTYKDTSPDAGSMVERSFCSECGSHIVIRNPSYPKSLVVTTGTLDYDDAGFKEWKPDREFFCKRKNAWLGDAGAAAENRHQAML